jgi:molybdopterin converting factor small subunit
MATVTLDPMLAQFVPKRRLNSPAKRIDELVSDLERRYPALRFRIRDESGEIRRFVKVFVNGRELAQLHGVATEVGPYDRVDVIHSIQGG